MNTLNLKKIAALALLALAAGSASLAHAHAKLEASEPKAAAVLEQAPKQIRLQFNSEVEPAFTKIKLVDASQAEVALPKPEPEAGNPKAFHCAVPALKAGDYQIQWSAVTRDGHKVKGAIPFKVQ